MPDDEMLFGVILNAERQKKIYEKRQAGDWNICSIRVHCAGRTGYPLYAAGRGRRGDRGRDWHTGPRFRHGSLERRDWKRRSGSAKCQRAYGAHEKPDKAGGEGAGDLQFFTGAEVLEEKGGLVREVDEDVHKWKYVRRIWLRPLLHRERV